MLLVDLEDDNHCYIGEYGEYQNWNIDPEQPYVDAIPIQWLAETYKDNELVQKIIEEWRRNENAW